MRETFVLRDGRNHFFLQWTRLLLLLLLPVDGVGAGVAGAVGDGYNDNNGNSEHYVPLAPQVENTAPIRINVAHALQNLLVCLLSQQQSLITDFRTSDSGKLRPKVGLFILVRYALNYVKPNLYENNSSLEC